MRQFKMTRRGTFTLDNSVENQCKAPGHKKYNYIIVSVCEDHLDENDFIVDHIEIDKVVQSTKLSTSCELLCKKISERVYKMLVSHGTRVRSIEVEIEPAVKTPVSKMQYTEVY